MKNKQNIMNKKNKMNMILKILKNKNKGQEEKLKDK